MPRHDTTKILLNFQLADKLRGYDVDRAMKHVEAGHAIEKNLDNDYYKAYYSKIKGECLFDMANYAKRNCIMIPPWCFLTV